MAAFLKYLLYSASIISSLLLIGIIMIQQNKAGGGLGAVSGGMTENMFGTAAGNVLTKATTWLAVIFLVSTLFLGTVIGHMSKDNKSVAEAIPVAETVKAEPAKPAEAPKAEAKPAEAPKAEAKPAEAPKAEAKPAEATK